MKFNIGKLCSLGLRFLSKDESGQMWADEDTPIREQPNEQKGYWRIADKFLPPKKPESVYYYIDPDTHHVLCADEVAEEEYRDRTTRHYAYYIFAKRVVRVPISDCPFEIVWEDEPFDLVANKIVAESDIKQWKYTPTF